MEKKRKFLSENFSFCNKICGIVISCNVTLRGDFRGSRKIKSHKIAVSKSEQQNV